ncbi:MAG: GntR family transcriptional regulator [Dokdonella sp.]|nr:GntR family transcriptional regulator [Dokdonella sp.]
MEDTSITWFELYDELRSKIKSGELRAEADLEKSTIASHASDIDYRRAIDRLIDEGLLHKSSSDELTVSRVRARSRRSASFQEDYAAQGRSPTTRTIALTLVPLGDAPTFVQETLRDTACSMLMRHYHLQCVDGVPHALADSYVPYELVGTKWKDIQTGNHDVFAVLSDLGMVVTEKQEKLYVDAPTLSEREQLGMLSMPGLQVVRLDCVVWSGDKIVEVCLLCDRADLYEFTYRVRTSGN